MKNKNTILDTAKQTILAESNAISNLVNLLTNDFEKAVKHFHASKGIMSKNPKTMKLDTMAVEALKTLENNNITQLLIEDNTTYIGVIHLHNLLKEGIY